MPIPFFASLALSAAAPRCGLLLALGLLAAGCSGSGPKGRFAMLEPSGLKRHVESFNAMDAEEAVVNLVPNADSFDWLQRQIPLFECPDEDLAEIYYFRWWALRKHLKQVGDYFAYTEFIQLETKAKFIPPERTIASALGHHFMETRWLRDQTADDSYLDYWMVGNGGEPQGHFHRYSSWLDDALWRRAAVTGDTDFLLQRLDRLVADYRLWEEERQRPDGLYWQFDVWDAMEESISGSRTEKHIRPTINSYMYGNAVALAKLARLAGREELAREFDGKAAKLRAQALDTLWNPDSAFFEVVRESGGFAGVREAIGFIPWYFSMPTKNSGYEEAWKQLRDPEGFWAPMGLTTAERRHPEFRSHGVGTCEWDGAIWPYATSQTLKALGVVVRDYPQDIVSGQDFYDAFLAYTRSQRWDGKPYIGEYQDEVTGAWLKGPNPRSKFYHHSTYADLLIADLVGLRPQMGDTVRLEPLLPPDAWDWFCLDGVPYHGHSLTIAWDRDGSRYGLGAGLRLLVDGEQIAHRASLGVLEGRLP